MTTYVQICKEYLHKTAILACFRVDVLYTYTAYCISACIDCTYIYKNVKSIYSLLYVVYICMYALYMCYASVMYALCYC